MSEGQVIDKRNKLELGIKTFAIVALLGLALLSKFKSDNKQITIAKELSNILGNLRANNAYIRVEDGENTYQTLLYNANGESISQLDNGQLTIFRKDSKVVGLTDSISTGVDLISTVESALKLVENGYAKAHETTKDNILAKEGFKSYSIKVKGKNNIKNMYMHLGSEYADDMANGLVEALSGDLNLELEYQFIVGVNDELSIACLINTAGSTYTNWIFDGYIYMPDWSLGEKWYSYDFTDKEVNQQMITDLLGDISNMMHEYADKNNLQEEVENHVDSSKNASDITIEQSESADLIEKADNNIKN